MAENPKNPEQEVERVPSIHGGANSRFVPWIIKEDQVEHVENLEIDEVGVRHQRRGTRAFGGPHGAGLVPGGIDWYNSVAFDVNLVGVWGSGVYSSVGNGGWNGIASDASLVSGLLHQFVRGRHFGPNPATSDPGLAFAFCTCEEPTDPSQGVFGRSQLVIYQVADDEATQVSLAPRTMTVFQNRLFYAEGELVGWSEIGDLASYSDVNSILIEPGTGGEITALLPARDLDPKMWVFKKDAVFLFSPRWGSDSSFIPTDADALDTINSSVRVLSRGAGCVATLSLQWMPGEEGADAFFLAADGVRALSRTDSDVQTGAGFPISYTIPKWIERINFATAHRAVAAVFDNAYHLAVPFDGANDNTHTLRYDIATKAWSLHSWSPRAFTVAQLGNEAKLFMQNNFAAGDTSTTEAVLTDPPFQAYELYRGGFDPSTDVTNVARVITREESRVFLLGDPTLRKRWDRFTMQFSSAETSRVDVAYRRDRGGVVPLTEMEISGSAGVIVLGEDALPWTDQEDLVRFKSLGLSDISPSYSLQMIIGGVTGMTEAGRMSYYLYELMGHQLQRSIQEDF